MTTFLYSSRYFSDSGPQGMVLDSSMAKRHPRGVARFHGPITLNPGMVYVPSSSHLKFPTQFHFKNAQKRGWDLLFALDGLKRIDYNREVLDDGVLLQFGSVQEAVLFKLSW